MIHKRNGPPRLKHPACVHCERRAGFCAGGLCRTCVRKPEIRARYAEHAPPKHLKQLRLSEMPLDWSVSGLYPCDRCIRGAATHPRGLCPPCDAAYPDWQPVEREQPPLTLCGHVHGPPVAAGIKRTSEY